MSEDELADFVVTGSLSAEEVALIPPVGHAVRLVAKTVSEMEYDDPQPERPYFVELAFKEIK